MSLQNGLAPRLQGSKAPRLHLQILEAVHFFSVLRTKCFRSIVYWLYPGMWWKCVRWRTTHCLVYLSFSIIVRARKEDRWLASVITCRKSFSFNHFYSCFFFALPVKIILRETVSNEQGKHSFAWSWCVSVRTAEWTGKTPLHGLYTTLEGAFQKRAALSWKRAIVCRTV